MKACNQTVINQQAAGVTARKALLISTLLMIWGLLLGSPILPATAATLEEPLKIGVLLSVGGLGDKSFNDATYAGIQNLRQRAGISVDVVEPANVAAMPEALEYLTSRKPDLVFAIGFFANEAIRTVSGKYPAQKYVLIDSVVTAPNVLSILFNEEEGSFYAGALAGLLSQTKKVGFLGGMKSPVIASFEKGFKNGLTFVTPDAIFISRFAGDTPEAFSLPQVGQKLGLEIAQQGADIIYHAAGATGLGLIEAARREKFMVIGVDSDQSTLVPGKVVASMVKRVDVAMEKALAMLREKRFQGGVLTLGLADSGVELVLSRFNKALLTPVIQERLKEVETFMLHPTAKSGGRTEKEP